MRKDSDDPAKTRSPSGKGTMVELPGAAAARLRAWKRLS